MMAKREKDREREWRRGQIWSEREKVIYGVREERERAQIGTANLVKYFSLYIK